MSLLWAFNGHATNVGGVFGPTVTEGGKTFQYRGAYDPDTEELVQRIHYQQALNSNVRICGVLQARRTDNSDLDVDFFKANYCGNSKTLKKTGSTLCVLMLGLPTQVGVD